MDGHNGPAGAGRPEPIAPPGKREARHARKLARQAARLARETARFERAEEQRVARLERGVRLQEALPSRQPMAIAGQSQPRLQSPTLLRARRGLLIVNSKSGANQDSLMRVRDLVALLAAHGIRAEVRVKLRKSQARDEARAAARHGYAVVIAAGGDGTVEAVARGLVGSRTALGIIPLGTYNNVAHSLGVPESAEAACGLMAAANPRPIDLVQAEVRGRNKPRLFFEMASIGLGATLIPVGQDAEKGRWAEALASLPDVLNMNPAGALLRLDQAAEPWWAYTLLVTVNNTPLAGAALPLAPAARADDGLLDLAVYHDLRQADLAARLLALKTGQLQPDERVRRARAQHVEVHTERPMPVAADSKLIGATPARFSVLAGALLTFVGDAPSLLHPAAPTAVARAASLRRAPLPDPARQRPPDLLPALAPPLTALRRGALPAAVALAALALLRRRLR